MLALQARPRRELGVKKLRLGPLGAWTGGRRAGHPPTIVGQSPPGERGSRLLRVSVRCVAITHCHEVGNWGLPRSGGAEGLGNTLLVIGEALDLPALADQALPERNAVVVDRHHGIGLPNQRMQP